MLVSFRASLTFEPSLSVTSNTSTNQPPSLLILADFTLSPSSVKCWTTCGTAGRCRLGLRLQSTVSYIR